MCPRLPGERRYDLKCVLGKCASCGFDEHFQICPVEQRAMGMYYPCRFLANRTQYSSSGKAKEVKVEVTTDVTWRNFLEDTKRELVSFRIHDFVARWQAQLYHDMFEWLPQDCEMWISDYIENFKCFSKIEIQQEFYNRSSISIFICLVIRRRRADEPIGAGVGDYHLPDRLACDVHVFVSDDKTHDAGMACHAWEEVANWTIKKTGKMPRFVSHWTDGAPNQFKFTLPIWFLNAFYRKYEGHGLRHLWWLFFASCHGKGMQDAAGAWIKSVVARAILLGGVINDLRTFAQYCEECLLMARQAPIGKRRKPLTSNRIIHVVEEDTIAAYRAALPTATTWGKDTKSTFGSLRQNHMFFAVPEENRVGRRWVGCLCDSCAPTDEGPRFSECCNANRFLVDGENVNKTVEKTIKVVYRSSHSHADDIGESLKVPPLIPFRA